MQVNFFISHNVIISQWYKAVYLSLIKNRYFVYQFGHSVRQSQCLLTVEMNQKQ